MRRGRERCGRSRDSNMLSVGSGVDEGCARRALEQRRFRSGPCTVRHHARPGWWQKPGRPRSQRYRCSFIYISNQIALPGRRGIPEKKCNYVI